jgi:hypothetical protein
LRLSFGAVNGDKLFDFCLLRNSPMFWCFAAPGIRGNPAKGVTSLNVYQQTLQRTKKRPLMDQEN